MLKEPVLEVVLLNARLQEKISLKVNIGKICKENRDTCHRKQRAMF